MMVNSFHSDIIKTKEACEGSTAFRIHFVRTFVYKPGKGKAVPLQARMGPEGSRKIRFPHFVTTAQDGGTWSALRTDRLYPQEILLVLISVRG